MRSIVIRRQKTCWQILETKISLEHPNWGVTGLNKSCLKDVLSGARQMVFSRIMSTLKAGGELTHTTP